MALTLVVGLAAGRFTFDVGQAQAQDFRGARLLGFADSRRALAITNDAIYINPAGLAMAQQYSIESGYIDDFRGSDRRFNGSVLDSQAGPLAAGLAYTYSTRRPDDVPDGNIRIEGHRADLALASRIAASAAIGVSLRYLSFDRTGDDSVEGTGFSLFNLDAGLRYQLLENVSIGVVGYNLIKNDRAETPIQLGGGLGFNGGLFTIEADVLYDFQVEDLQVSGGGSFVLGDMFPVRAGVSWDQTSDEWQLSVGLGFFVKQLAVDLAYRQSLNPQGTGDDKDGRLFAVAVRAVVF